MEKKSPVIRPQDIRLILKLLGKNWYLLVALPLLGAALGFYVGYKKPNIYKAKMEMIINPMGSSTSRMTGQYSYFQFYQAYANLANQKRVLKSYDLIDEVVERLNIKVSYYSIGKIRTVDLYDRSVFSIQPVSFDNSMMEHPVYVRFGKEAIKVEYEWGDKSMSYEFPYGEKRWKTPHFEVLFSQSDPDGIPGLKKRVNSQYMFKFRNKRSLVSYFRNQLNISDLEESSVIIVDVQDQVEHRAVDFLDSLVQVYSEYSVRERVKINNSTQNYINTQLEELADRINEGEFELQNFKNKESIFDLTAEESRYFDKLVELDESVKKLDLRLQTVEKLQDYIQSSQDNNLLPPAFYIPEGDKYIESTLEELYKMKVDKTEILYDLKEKNPNVNRSEHSLEVLKSDMLGYLADTKKAIREKINELNSRILRYEKLLRGIPESQREIINIQRRISVNEKLYNYLLEQRANVAIEKAAIAPESEVVDRPRSLGAVSPNRNRILQIYTLGGLALAIALGAIRFLFFDKMETIQEIKDHSDIPVLAGVPMYKSEMLPNNPRYSDSGVAESFRKIRTNLRFFSLDDSRMILVTSLFPSEGKTFNTIHIATSLAFSGKRVVIVDFDLHKPSVHKKLHLPNTQGLSLVLSKKETDYTQQLHHIVQNLDVITSGPLPPNPSDLVLSPVVNEFFTQLQKDYDYVVIDTPPLHLITDANVLMKYTDINIMVLHVKNASVNTLRDIEEFREETRPDNFALILNGMRVPRWTYLYGKYNYKYAYKYGYGYGYGYGGYGYGYGEKKNKT